MTAGGRTTAAGALRDLGSGGPPGARAAASSRDGRWHGWRETWAGELAGLGGRWRVGGEEAGGGRLGRGQPVAPVTAWFH